MNENNQGKNMERSREKNNVYGIKSNEEERFERSGVMNFTAYCHPDTSTVYLQHKQTYIFSIHF